MNHIDHYSSKLSTIRLIPEEKILKTAGIPIRVYLQEAENIFNWCIHDREKLTANGLDWTLVEDIPARIDTLREAQSRWATSDSADTASEKEWNEKSPMAHAFRRDLVRSLKFVFRNNSAAISKINRLGSGNSNASMMQSLRDISVFGQENIEFLKEAKYDITALETAEQMSRDMAALLGAVSTARAFNSASLRLRDQAYTHLFNAMKELKSHAAYVFVHDNARLRGYTSDYYRKRYIKNRNQKTQKAAEEKTE
ncbi:MAG TPA: hypothetical protein PK514_05920 [Spirochaetota bacterium]|nr:hypothetical protein [Spirochaetota bacterium]